MEKITIDKRLLQGLIGYVHTLQDAIDVEDEEILNEINDGYESFVKPLLDIAYDSNAENEENDERVIAKQVDIQDFKESLEDIYDVDIAKFSDKEINEMFDELGEILANNDDYAEIYNDAVWQVLKNHEISSSSKNCDDADAKTLAIESFRNWLVQTLMKHSTENIDIVYDDELGEYCIKYHSDCDSFGIYGSEFEEFEDKEIFEKHLIALADAFGVGYCF